MFGTTNLPTLIALPELIEVLKLTDVPKLSDVLKLTEVSFLTVFGRRVTNTTCSRNLQDMQHLIPNGIQSTEMTKVYDEVTSTMQAAGLTPVMDRYVRCLTYRGY